MIQSAPQPSPAASDMASISAAPAFAGLGDLRSLPKYRPRGIMAPTGWYLAPVFCLVAFAVGAVASRLVTGDANAVKQFHPLFSIVAPIVLSIFFFAFTLYATSKGIIRRWWAIVILNFIWMVCLVAGMQSHSLVDTVSSAAAGEIGSLIKLIGFVLLAGILAMIGLTINISDGFRVTYGSGTRARWANRHEVFFKGLTGRSVLDALQRGDASMLASLRGEGPTSFHAYQSYTTLQLALDPEDESAPGYLFIKDVWLGGGPIMAAKVHQTPGWACARHIQLSPDLTARLFALLPDLRARSRDATVLPEASKWPLGCPSGSPAFVHNVESGTWIGCLPQNERMPFHKVGARYLRLALWTLALSFVGMIVGVVLMDDKPSMTLANIVGVVGGVGGFVGIITGTLLLSNGAKLSGKKLRGSVASRSNSFIKAVDDALVIAIEESRTYDRQKLYPDDFGLMHAVPGWLFIEGGGFRARIASSDLRIEIRTTTSGAALMLTANAAGVPWSICIKDTSARKGTFITDPKVQAQELWTAIYARMTVPQPQQVL